jgi:hypothetical protein
MIQAALLKASGNDCINQIKNLTTEHFRDEVDAVYVDQERQISYDVF